MDPFAQQTFPFVLSSDRNGGRIHSIFRNDPHIFLSAGHCSIEEVLVQHSPAFFREQDKEIVKLRSLGFMDRNAVGKGQIRELVPGDIQDIAIAFHLDMVIRYINDLSISPL